MRYWVGAACFVTAAVLLGSSLLHRRRVQSIAPADLVQRHRAAALSDPRSLASMGEIGRSLVLAFVGYAVVKTTFLWFAFHADRYLSLVDLAGFYAVLAAYVVSVTVHTRWRLSDAREAAEGLARAAAVPEPSAAPEPSVAEEAAPRAAASVGTAAAARAAA